MLKKIIRYFPIQYQYEIGKKTWFGSGGNCSLFLKAETLKQLTTVLKITKKFLPYFIIGAGSNILVRDGGFKGLVIKLDKEFKDVHFDEKKNILSIGSAAKDHDVSKFCLKENITGFEFLSGIPGTIGGNLKMNAGCYGTCISEKLIDCKILDEDLKIKNLKKNQLNFGYRNSSFCSNQVILSARFHVKKGNHLKIQNKILKISKDRKKNQPIASRTGGSTFTNPSSNSAWKFIDEVKFRGKKLGGAKVSEIHPNFLINDNHASSLDIELLGEEIRIKVLEKFNIKLNWELMRIGEFRKV